MKATIHPKPIRLPVKPGDRFGHLVVLAFSGIRRYPNGHGPFRLWLCHCDCGAKKSFLETQLRSGKTSSCGCYRLQKSTIHGEADPSKRTSEYKTWSAMRDRCYNPNNPQYKDYGGRGITVCDRWRTSYPNFLADVGRRPSKLLSIDRINNDGNYEPGNVRWATRKQQQNNRRNTRPR